MFCRILRFLFKYGIKETNMKVAIIIPTYNERENIGPLITALHQQFETINHDMNILVVDDNSPDGTADEVRVLQNNHPKIQMIEGRKVGLGAAYIRGMLHAMEKMAVDVVFEMDADFSHKPEDVLRLMDEIDRGADFVIGSRYVIGGSIPSNWGFIRRLNSFGGNILARYVAGIYQVRDCTAGFRAIRTTVLRDIDLSRLRLQGYAFQIVLLHFAVTEGAKVVEVPVDFIDRTQGESKLGLSDIVEFVKNVWWIRLQSSRVFIKFAIVGISGVAINLGFFALLLTLGVNKYISSPIAIEAAIISNFLLNNYWTFKWRKTKDRTRIKGLKFNVVSLISIGVSYSTFLLVLAAYPALPPMIAQISGIVPAMLVNYFLNSYWTFRHVEH
jgi:dolichol-phosphate mannosyltransferase